MNRFTVRRSLEANTLTRSTQASRFGVGPGWVLPGQQGNTIRQRRDGAAQTQRGMARAGADEEKANLDPVQRLEKLGLEVRQSKFDLDQRPSNQRLPLSRPL